MTSGLGPLIGRASVGVGFEQPDAATVPEASGTPAVSPSREGLWLLWHAT